jgi:hypothetical protein
LYIGTPLLAPGTTSTLEMAVWGHGASAAATSEANRLMIEVLGSLRPSNLALLEGIDIQLHIIPKDKKLTDLPEFSARTGEKTVDGRLYDDVRGMGGEKFGGSILYAVGEETLVPIPGYPTPYGSGYVAAHESGHVVEQFALTNSQKKRLQDAYDDRKRANGPWLSLYAKSNPPHEYFASSTAAFYGHPRTNAASDRALFTRAWLRKNDGRMYGLLTDVYRKTT